MKKFYEWYLDCFGESVPNENLNGSWFVEKRLPMIVACTCCDMTMALPSAMIDEFDQIYCTDCANNI